MKKVSVSIVIVVADPDFCQYFCRKLHENERNWIERAGCVSLAAPLDPPMD